MQFIFSEMQTAVAEAISPTVASRLEPCLSAIRTALGDDSAVHLIESEEAARALTAALLGGDAARTLVETGWLSLTSLELLNETGAITLNGAEAANHPAVRGWIENSLVQAAVSPAVSSMLMLDAAPAAPTHMGVDFYFVGEGLVSAAVRMVFSTAGLHVAARYGDPNAGFTSQLTYNGEALRWLGVQLREAMLGDPETAPPEPVRASPPPPPAPTGATLH